MEGLVTDCVNYLTVERGVSTNTTKAYVRDLNEYVHFLSARGIDSVDAVVEVDVVDYLVFLRRYLASSTVARKLSAIKTFHKFLVREGVTQNLPTADMGSPKTPKRLPGTLAVEEVRRLMEAPADAGPLGLRDRALLEL
ncbi:MAG: site-specific integrase, partial [Terriglobia bacterium]